MGRWWGRGSGCLDPASSRSRVRRAWMGTHTGGSSGAAEGCVAPGHRGKVGEAAPPQGQTLESTDMPTGALALARESVTGAQTAATAGIVCLEWGGGPGPGRVWNVP